MSVSNVTIIGNLGRDPETRYTPNGRMNVQFTVATNRRWTDQAGQQQEKTNWFRVTAWGRLAETLDNLAQHGYLVNGRQVYVNGPLDAREYQDQNGQTRTSLDVNATEVQLVGGRPAESDAGEFSGRMDRGAAEELPESQELDDVPF
jgi:single-strand DNA-binding protein